MQCSAAPKDSPSVRAFLMPRKRRQRSGPRAAITGERLDVSLPLWQILLLIGAGVSVIFSVWLTTRDLGIEVGKLSRSVERWGRIGRALDKRMLRIEILNGIHKDSAMDEYEDENDGTE